MRLRRIAPLPLATLLESSRARAPWTVLGPGPALALLLGVRAAAAQPAVDLYQLETPTSAEGTIYLEPTNTPEPGTWHVGAVGSYGYRVITWEAPEGVALKHRATLDYVASLGVFERWSLGFALPTILYQRGEDLSVAGLPEPTRTALGDARFVVKSTLLGNSDLGGFGLAALGRVSLPTGDGTAYASDESTSGEARLIGELRLIALSLTTTLGLHARSEERTLAGHTYGHSLRWGGGIQVVPRALGLDDTGRWTVGAEFRGATALGPEFGASPQSFAVFGLSARVQAGDLGLLAGTELPLDQGLGTPLVRGIVGLRWAPRVPDQDGDGIEDELDECIDLAEDADHFEDSDGCPDFDNDDDGVPDENDRCPAEKEDEDGFSDDDGCVDPDNDGDRIEDARDRCPDEAGNPSPDPERNGCPARDTDHDGILDARDRCLEQPEDVDGFKDDDGCPDPDNDADSIPDAEDDCPGDSGPATSQGPGNGCPSPDKDGDTFDEPADQCPDEPEDFDGILDLDGCADPGPGAPRLRLSYREGHTVVVWREELRLASVAGGVDVDANGMLALRALAQLLNAEPEAVALVGVAPRSDSPEDQELAVREGFAVVLGLRRLTHRDAAADLVAWQSIPAERGRRQRVGVIVSRPGSKPTSSPSPRSVGK